MAIRDGIHAAESEEEREAVFRFRYDVYVEELGRYRNTADHENRRLVEPEDERGRISYAALDGRVIGTARMSWGGDDAISPRQIRVYGLEPFLAEIPADAVGVGERGMIARPFRGSDLFMEMIRTGLRSSNERRIQVTFGACEPHLLNLYLGLGHRTYSRDNINSAEAGFLVPMLFLTEDVGYLRRIGSPLAEAVRDFGSDARVPECVQRILAAGSAVTASRLSSPAAYWTAVHGALEEAEDQRISALDGLSDAEAHRCLAKSTIIECDAGDRVLKEGGTARNLFVVLDGTLEVRDGPALVNLLRPGDVFGEIAFLLERPRTKDVYAACDGVRVLSLSESLIREMIDEDAPVAAQLLLNIAKMLCLRLLRQA